MRRLSLALVALSLPAASLAAQRISIPLVRGRGPQRPAEKPPQAPGIHDARLYSRYAFSRFSFESAPMLTYMQTTGLIGPGAAANYMAFGDATQLSFRATPSLLLTGAFTSTAMGGPFAMASSELGFRVKPWTAPRVAPFAEARMSWAFSSNTYAPSSAVPFLALYRSAYDDFATGAGRGGILGVGADTRLTSRFSVTTALSYTRYAMSARNLYGNAASWGYTNRMTRLTVGVRYNHGRWIDAP
jgi:hypothetical protein